MATNGVWEDVVGKAVREAALAGAGELLALHGASPRKLRVVYKAADGETPRSVADLRSGTAMKAVLKKRLPGCKVKDEELGTESGKAGQVFSDVDVTQDPLDGTSGYTREQRYSTVGIVANKSGIPYAAAICNPFEAELIFALAGRGAYCINLSRDKKLTCLGTGKQIFVSRTRLSEKNAMVCLDALFNAKTSGPKLRFMQLVRGLNFLTKALLEK